MRFLWLIPTLAALLLMLLLQLPGYAVLVLPMGNLDIHVGLLLWAVLLLLWMTWAVARRWPRRR